MNPRRRRSVITRGSMGCVSSHSCFARVRRASLRQDRTVMNFGEWAIRAPYLIERSKAFYARSRTYAFLWAYTLAWCVTDEMQASQGKGAQPPQICLQERSGHFQKHTAPLAFS
jgi:hypothetical protein